MAVDKLVDSAQLETDLTSIANAIRNKGRTSDLLSFPTGFVSAINDIQTGSGSGSESEDSDEVLVEKDVNFIDYDGTLLYSYTAAEANALTALPASPSHAGLVAQGWNWTLAEIKSRLASSTGAFFVGQMYTTASGNTEIDIDIDETTVNVPILFKISYKNPNGDGCQIHWGENDEISSLNNTTTTLSTIWRYPHTYTNIGRYTISVEATNGAEIQLSVRGTSSFSGLFWGTDIWASEANKAIGHSSIIKAIRVGNNCRLAYRSFSNCISMEYVTLPNTIAQNTATLQDYTFLNCHNLKSIIIPRGITTINNYAFKDCWSLESVSLPGTISNMSYGGFYKGCFRLKNLYIRSNETKIYSLLAQDLWNLKYISIPNTITTIADAFYMCYGLTSIIIPNSVTTIQSSAFQDCRFLKNVTMSNNLTSLGASSFKNCYLLESIELPNTLTTFGANAFDNCKSLKNVLLPNNLITIPEGAFYACESLRTIDLPNTITTINGQAFYQCYALESIEIPDSVTTLSNYTFDSCWSLSSVKLPNSVTSIGDRCFYCCYRIREITIPSTVTSIGTAAFQALLACKAFHFLSTTPPTIASTNTFSSIRSDAVMYVPQGCLEAYQMANNWSSYASYMQEEPST